MSPPGSDIRVYRPTDLSNPMKGKDFFKFVNGRWLASVHVPPHISSYGVSEEVEQSIVLRLDAIIRKCIHQSKLPQANLNYDQQTESAMGIVAQSALNSKVQYKSIKSLQTILSDLRCMRDATDIARTLGEFVKYKVPGVFWMFAQYENQHDTKYTYTIGVGKVGLPTLSYYKKGRTLLKYAKLLQTLGTKFDIPTLSSIIPTEELLASAIQKSFADNQFQGKGSELATRYKDIPLATLFETIGISDWKTQTFFVDSHNWMKTLEKLFTFLPLDLWRLLLTTEILLHALPYLPPPFDDLHYDFFHKYLRGQAMKVPQKTLTVKLLEQWMTPFFSKLYVEHTTQPRLKTNTTKLTEELLTAAKHRLQQTDWLQPSTQKEAIKKVDKMKLSIGYPSHFSTFPIPDVKSDNLLDNLLTLGSWQTSYEIKRLGQKRKEQVDWDEPVFAVNAYYYSQSNEIVMPLGSLYWPFYSDTAPLGWNYGGLGCIIGHELTHAFDKEGKEYDPDGFPKKWWTTADNRAYNKKTKRIIQLFGEQKILDHPVNGSLTLSENIADLGGVAIALDALRVRIEQESCSPSEMKKAYQQFFLSYAVSWRVKEKPEKVLQSLLLDYHSPPSMRVNLVVSQFQEWYDAFDISEKDPMYIPQDKRIRIF